MRWSGRARQGETHRHPRHLTPGTLGIPSVHPRHPRGTPGATAQAAQREGSRAATGPGSWCGMPGSPPILITTHARPAAGNSRGWGGRWLCLQTHSAAVAGVAGAAGLPAAGFHRQPVAIRCISLLFFFGLCPPLFPLGGTAFHPSIHIHPHSERPLLAATASWAGTRRLLEPFVLLVPGRESWSLPLSTRSRPTNPEISLPPPTPVD